MGYLIALIISLSNCRNNAKAKNGIDTIIGERGVRLSGGQRQRIALARAFYHGRNILVMDESTSALDSETEKEIVDEIQKFKGKKTIILIAYRFSTIQYCERIYKLENGKTIYIEQFERGNRIWDVNEQTNEFKEIASVWNFIAMGKQCEHIKNKNFYFAQNLEYWFAGGTNIDYPEIRIFDLYDPSPWRDSDLGITLNMKYAKEWCIFYKPTYQKKILSLQTDF